MSLNTNLATAWAIFISTCTISVFALGLFKNVHLYAMRFEKMHTRQKTKNTTKGSVAETATYTPLRACAKETLACRTRLVRSLPGSGSSARSQANEARPRLPTPPCLFCVPGKVSVPFQTYRHLFLPAATANTVTPYVAALWALPSIRV